MDLTTVTLLFRDSMWLVLKFSLPFVGSALVLGVIISLFQAVTQIQEMTLTFMPKFLVIMVLMVVLMPWMASHMILFFNQIAHLIMIPSSS
jgi:flagellar biosynthetic protein FliQ